MQNMPVGSWPSIRQQPLYVRFRHRLVNEAIKESRIRLAVKGKAQGVIDYSNI